MEHGVGGVADQFRVERAGRFADQLDRDQFGGARDGVAAVHLKHQTIRMQLNHVCSSSFLTACTKSVASWNRR